MGEADDPLGFCGIADHRHHDAVRAHIERAGHEMIFGCRHADQRCDRQPAGRRQHLLDRLEADPGMLHVE